VSHGVLAYIPQVAETTWVAGCSVYIPRWFIHQMTVTHPNANGIL